LRERVAASRAVDADLFISLHADSIADSRLRGASIYTLSEQSSDKEAARLAEQENKSDIIAGMDFSDETPEVTNILIDLAQRETMNQSARFAGFLAQELRGAVRTHRRAHRFAGFAVLKAPDVPSALLEIGYLSNPEEERMLRSRAFQERIAVAVRRGIDHYFAAVKSAAR
jgi:N-acetylmuramoyl-L-alanine amidase